MKNSTNFGYSTKTSTSESIMGTTSSSTTVTSYYQGTSVVNGLFQGGKDRKTPNPFKFDIVKSGWGRKADYTRSVAYGQLATYSAEGPFMPANFNSLGLQNTSPDWSRVENAAMAKIYDQLKGNNNLIVDLAEGGQTVKMVKSVLNLKKFILNFVTDVVKHRKFKRVPKGPDQNQRRLDYVNGKWLEVRYGWTPLIHSIYDAADNINRDLSARQIYVKGRSGVKVSFDKPVYLDSVTNETLWLSGYSSSYRVEYGMVFNLPGGPKISDWTSLNPIGIAYELMTLSFVLDWVVDIGGYLSLWENNCLFGKHFVAGYMNRSYKEHYTYNRSYYSYDPFIPYPNGKGFYSGREEISSASAYTIRLGSERVRLLDLPTPSGVTVKVRFGWKHQLDAVALFSQLIGKKLRP